MSDRLDELVSSIEAHVKDKRAELTALQTQARALQSAHEDLHQEVLKSQAKLLEIRNAIAASGKELEERRAEAQRIASEIITAAHDKLADAEADSRELRAQHSADAIVADKHLRGIEGKIAEGEELLKALNNEIGAKRTELAAIKQQARQFADG